MLDGFASSFFRISQGLMGSYCMWIFYGYLLKNGITGVMSYQKSHKWKKIRITLGVDLDHQEL